MGMGNFARGFVPSFNDAYERNQRRQDDMFNKMYEEFKSKRDQAAEYKRENSKQVKTAESIAADLGLPEGAWVEAYKRLQNGYTIEQTKKALEGFNIKPSELPAGQVNPANAQTDQMLEGSSTSNAPVTDLAPIDLLTQDKSPEGKAKAIMASPLTQEVPQAQPQGVMGRITQGLDGYRSLVNRRNTNAVMERLAAVTGASPEELQQMFNANPDLSRPIGELIQEGQTAAPQSSQNPQVAQAPYTMERIEQPGALSDEDRKRAYQIIDAVSKDMQEYKAQKGIAKSVVGDVQDMYQLIQRSPAIQNALTRNIAQAITSGVSAGTSLSALFIGPDNEAPKSFNLYDQVRSQVQSNPSNDPKIEAQNRTILQNAIVKTEKAIDEWISSPVGQRVMQTGTDATIYEMKMQVMAYKLAMLYQQEGRSLAETERVMFQEMASGGNTPEKFLEKLGLLVTGEVDRLENKKNEMINDPRVQNFRLTTRQDIPGFNEAFEGSLEEELSNDPNIGEFYKQLRKSSLSSVSGPQVQPQPQTLYTEVPPESIELIRSNPNDPTLKKYFIATYGEEAYRKYTNGK